jgi:hypothetical protein
MLSSDTRLANAPNRTLDPGATGRGDRDGDGDKHEEVLDRVGSLSPEAPSGGFDSRRLQ